MGNVGQSGRAAEDGHLQADHVSVDGERSDTVGCVVDDHRGAGKCGDVAGPLDAPGQLDQCRPGDRDDPMLILAALRQAAHLQSEMEAVVDGGAADISFLQQCLQQPIDDGPRHAGLPALG